MAEFNVLQNLHLCAQKSFGATNLGPFGEIGANFSLQLSSRTWFDKIDKKKVIAENQCEKHKKSSFFFLVYNQSLKTVSESRLFGSVVRALVLYRGDPGSIPSEHTGNFSAMLYFVTAIMS